MHQVFIAIKCKCAQNEQLFIGIPFIALLIIFVVVFFLSSSEFSISFAKSISDEAEQQFRLAQKLEEEGNTFQAITEYERFLYFLPGHPKSPSVLYRLIRCRYKMREWGKAIAEAKNFENKYPENPLLLPVKVLLGESLIESGSLQKGRETLEGLHSSPGVSVWKDEITKEIGRSYVLEGNFGEARKIALGKTGNSANYEGKSPWIAGVGAGLLPGFGHLYNGRPKDAWTAFFYTGILSAITWEACSNDHPWLAGAFGAGAATFYTGNIFSAVNVTYKGNKERERKWLSKSLGFIPGNIAPELIQDIHQETIPVSSAHERAVKSRGSSATSWMFRAGISLFRKFISPIDNSFCPSYPSCSSYSLQAFRHHGAFWGSMLTVDRLIHEASEAKHAPFIVINGQKKIYDPLWVNDFLLKKPKATSKKGGGKIHDL